MRVRPGWPPAVFPGIPPDPPGTSVRAARSSGSPCVSDRVPRSPSSAAAALARPAASARRLENAFPCRPEGLESP